MKTFLLVLFLSGTIIHNSFGQQSPITVTVDGKSVVFECVATVKSYNSYDRHNEDSVIGKVQYIQIGGWCGIPNHSDFITIFIHGECCDMPVSEGKIPYDRYELRYNKYLSDTSKVIYTLAYDSSEIAYANITYADSSTIKGVFEGKVILYVGQPYDIKHTLFIKGSFDLPIYYIVNGEYILKKKKYFQL